ncbi:MAG TPA: uroporphyrinogen-III C-methyltransferase [Rhodanobacteraceae bacterium]|nr:uroporphyrinogen-III C-methyltransferase [Rhodanobacteraceae bacterium]
MSEQPDSDIESPVVATPTGADAPAAAQTPPARSRRGGRLAAAVALLALVVSGYVLWRDLARERGDSAAVAVLRSSLGERLDQLAAAQTQIKRDIATQRARLTDADSVNGSMREELLSLAERSRHLEDAVANLAEQRLSGRDALALNEAEFLLQLGAERLALFHDAKSALSAYRLADSALAAAEDPVFASVRQTIAAEIQALVAARPLQIRPTLDALERVRSTLATLPIKPAAVAPATPESSRLLRLLQPFVRVRSDEAILPGRRDVELARNLAAIDLRAAEAALLARDPKAFGTALARVRAELVATFDPADDALEHALTEIDRLAGTPFSPSLPELGSALKELRNLRATRALSRKPPASQAGSAPARTRPPPSRPAVRANHGHRIPQ